MITYKNKINFIQQIAITLNNGSFTAAGRVKVANNLINQIRLIHPDMEGLTILNIKANRSLTKFEIVIVPNTALNYIPRMYEFDVNIS